MYTKKTAPTTGEQLILRVGAMENLFFLLKTLPRRCINIVVHYFSSYLSLATKKQHSFQPKTKD